MALLINLNLAGHAFQISLHLGWHLLFDLLGPPPPPPHLLEEAALKPLTKNGEKKSCLPLTELCMVPADSDFITPEPFVMHSRSPLADKLVEDVNLGFEAGYLPELCDEGAGGTYFLKGQSGSTAGVFKPSDEEPYSPNNPKSSEVVPTSPERHGIRAGQGCVREVAAFVVDHHSGPSLQAGVPQTVFATVASSLCSKHGSLQEFIPDTTEAWDMGPSVFSVEDVHRIGVLDLRLLNTDRHGGNVLVTEDKRLVPIDHAFCLPESLDEGIWFEWMTWPQAKLPFSSDMRSSILDYDLIGDLQRLSALGLSPIAVALAGMAGLLLKMGVEAGLSLYEIGRIVCRPKPQEPSRFEVVVRKAVEMSADSNQLSVFSAYRSLLRQGLGSSQVLEVDE